MSRYVDDIIIVCQNHTVFSAVQELIRSSAPGLTFTVEHTVDAKFQHLDVALYTAHGLCWEYGKSKCKPVLPAFCIILGW